MNRHPTFTIPFFGVLALVLAGALAIQLTTVRYLPPVQISSPAVQEYEPPALPRLERLRQPHAILVLDISASMQKSDPKRWQALAVEQFYTAFRDLAREVAPKGESARIAVVLFSTLAQVIDWDGAGTPWLEVSQSSSDRFLSAIRAGIGSEAKEAREGRDTDYLAALREVSRLADGLQSPPAVIFMTDGGNEPHGLFTPALTRAEREQMFPEALNARSLLKDIEAGRYRYLRFPGTTAFDRRQFGIGPRPLRGEILQRTRQAAQNALSELQAQRFWLSEDHPAVPLFWVPVFLDAGAEPAEAIDVREILRGQGTNEPWEGSPKVLVCQDPKDLSRQFIGALAVWLRMARREVGTSAVDVQAPSDSLAFALSIQTERPGTRCDLVSGDRRISLTGRNGVWAGVSSGGGKWQFDTDGGAVRSGVLYYRPRYRWVVHAPRRQTIDGENGKPIPVEVYLLSLEKGRPVSAGAVYPDLPAELPARATFEADNQKVGLLLKRVAPPSDAAYRGFLPLEVHTGGTGEITVDFSGLAQRGITVEAREISQRIELRNGLRVAVSTAEGRPSALGVSGVPREGESLRQFWKKVRRGHEP